MQIYLETERILLRQFTPDDVDCLYALDSDPEVMRYLTNGVPRSYAETKNETLPRHIAYYEKFAHFGVWAAIEKETGAFIGWFHFRPDARNPEEDIELGYRLMRLVWDKGYATEVSRALIRKGFEELGVKRVTARAMKANVNSWRVMEKVGMNFEMEYIEEKFPVDDQTAVRYELSREAYNKNKFLTDRQILEMVRERLKACPLEGMTVEALAEGMERRGTRLYIWVSPSEQPERTFAYYDALAEVETLLSMDDGIEVELIPIFAGRVAC